jgi:hypothetical protein
LPHSWQNSWEFGDPVVRGIFVSQAPAGRLVATETYSEPIWISADTIMKTLMRDPPLTIRALEDTLVVEGYLIEDDKPLVGPTLKPLTAEQVRALRGDPAMLVNPCMTIKPRPLLGYHLTEIPKGRYGELSKVVEEGFEVYDAMAQGSRIMLLVEFTDLLGAIRGYAEHQGFNLLTELTRYEAICQGTVSEIVADAVKITECNSRDCEMRRFARIIMNIERVLMTYGLSMDDAWLMERATHRAFRNGVRHDRSGQEDSSRPAGDG